MKRLIPLVAACTLALAGTAQAHGFPITIIRTTTITGPPAHKTAKLEPATCPAGVPVQTITVINRAHARSAALAKVERAVVDQSMQLRAAWGTPCVKFGPGGWPLYLTATPPTVNADGSSTATVTGRHEPGALYVDTGTNTADIWSKGFSHETLEALEDPNDDKPWTMGRLLEVCDPVENSTYQLDNVTVSNFVLPSYFQDAPGPWDEVGVLTGAPGPYTIPLG